MRGWAVGLAAAACLAVIQPAAAQLKRERLEQKPQAWTAEIHQAFVGNIYVWCLKPNGTYSEGGTEAKTGLSVQPTLTGTWGVKNGRTVLRQDSPRFVFDGVVNGDRFSGKLYLDGETVSTFTATRGAKDAPDCGDQLVS